MSLFYQLLFSFISQLLFLSTTERRVLKSVTVIRIDLIFPPDFSVSYSNFEAVYSGSYTFCPFDSFVIICYNSVVLINGYSEEAFRESSPGEDLIQIFSLMQIVSFNPCQPPIR